MENIQQQLARMQETMQFLADQNQELNQRLRTAEDQNQVAHQRVQAAEASATAAASTSLPPGHSPRGHTTLLNDVRDIGKPKQFDGQRNWRDWSVVM